MARPLNVFKDVAQLRWFLGQAVRRLEPTKLLTLGAREAIIRCINSALAKTKR